MKASILKRKLEQVARCICAAVAFTAILMPGGTLFAQTTTTQTTTEQEAPIPPEQLDSLVAPIALYPDNLLSQTLVASTYPLEIIQLYQWLEKNKDLQKDQKKLTEKVSKQGWDASIQAMAALPDLVKFLAEDIAWTTDLGNAFLAQQKDVMDSIQRMRSKATEKGSLKSNEQMKVETQVVESKSVIVIEQSNPEVIYVPSYDPVVVYGPPVYPYPPIYYPPYPAGGYVAAGLIGFGVGVAIGAAWGGGWGWGCGWGGGDININRNNNFNRNTNINGGNRVNNIGSGNRVNQGGNKWQHNPQHRGGASYGDRKTADRFGGTTRGDSLQNRRNTAQRDLGNRQSLSNRSDGLGNRNQGGLGDRNSGGLGNRNQGGLGDRNSGGLNNRNQGGLNNRNQGGLGDRNSGGLNNRNSISDRTSGGGNRSNLGSSDKIGNRNLGNSGGRNNSSFGGGRSDGFSGGRSTMNSSRGSNSMSRGGGGGFSRGGGGGGRGGGGRRR